MPKLLAVLVATLPLGANHGLPEVELRVDGTPVRVLIDTGAYTGIALRPALVPPSARFAGQRRFRDARGQSHEAREFSLDRLELAGLVERDVHGQELVHAPDFAPPNRDGYVGRELLSRWRLLFDVPAGRLQLHA